MTRRSRRQREVGLKSEIKTAYAPPGISHAAEVAHNLSIRLYKYDPSIPNPIVLTKPLKPRAVSSSEDEDELEPVFPGPVCISCSGVDNDPLIWCSGCCEPFHYECAKGLPKSKIGTTYKWFCLDCRQSCISCSYPVLTISTFECKSCWRIIHRRCIDPQLRSGFRTNGWTCSDCLRPNHEIAPRSTCEICLSEPLPHCQPSYQCDRCRINVNSCCLDLSDDILHFYDNFAQRQIFLCENCDASSSWKNHLICAWRRSLLQILSPLSQLAKDHPEISSIQTNIDKFDSIEAFAKELKILTSNEKFRSEEIQRKFEHSKNVLEQIFPNYDAHVAELPEMEYPPEFTFHRRKAPVLPQFQTSLFRSPACCLCTAKPSYARLIYLGQDEWAHLACVLWAGRLANTKGNYSSMIRGYSHGIGPSAAREEDSCRHCGYSIRSAISVKCAKEGCNLVMHFFCARLTGWLVMDKMTSLCGRHKPRCESKKNMVLEASLSRKISLESAQIAEPSLLADLIKQELPSNTAQDQNTPPSDTKPVIQQNVATGTTIVRPGITPLPKTGKPSSFDRQTSPVKVAPILSNVNLKPKSPSSGGKPQAFQQMMSSPPPLIPGKKAPLAQSSDTQNSTLRELLRASPSQSTPIPASPLSVKSSPIAQQKVISPQQQQQQRLKIIPIESQVNSQAMASNIMNKKPELQHFGQDKLSQLIETLFNEGPSSKPSSVNHFSSNLKQSSDSSMPSTTQLQSQLPPNLTPKPFLNQSHVQSAPSATPVSEKVMPQLQRSIPNQNPPPLQQSPSHKTPPKVQPSPFLDIPQTDGVIDLDQLSPALSDNNEDNEDSDFDISDDDAPLLPKMASETGDAEKRHKKPRAAYGSLKKKKITLEEVFTDVENMLLRKGRARPDHNDQAHHHKSKWAHGVRPEDAYIALGGLSVKNLGKIHPETTQCYKEALCPEGYEAVRWFWSAKNPGNLTKYILNVVVEHTPLPEAVYVNETIVHEPELVTPLPEEDISEASTPIACETITYTFDDFPEWQEAKMKEIAPPRTFLEARKRSAEIEASQIVPEKRGRRGRQKVVKKEVLETDDEDTEDILNRRSVRVWANKIKKEFVEEVVIPEELDGFKVPTDDEDDFEETVDPMDTSFKIEKEEPAKPLRVQSKRMSKFKNAPKRSSRSRRGRRNDYFSDEENDRNDEELHEVELIIDDFEGRSPDSDRPNNVEMMSLSDVRTLLRSDDEDDELIIKRKSRRMKLTSLDSDSESDEKSSQKSPEPAVANNQEMSTLESIETVSIETESREIITIASSPDETKEEPETIIVEPEVIESSPIDENEEDKRQYEADVLETVLENVDPEILLQARKVSTDSEESKAAESADEEEETDDQKDENDTKIEESTVKDDELEDEPSTPLKLASDVDETEDESPSVDTPANDDAKADEVNASTGSEQNAAEIPPVEDPSADEDKSESIGEEPESVDEEIESSESSSVKDAAQSNSEQSPDAEDTENWSPDTEAENDMEDMFRIEEHDELDDASEKSSEQLAKELTQSFVRRSGRAVKSLPCAVKDCDKTFKDIEKTLLHMKVNHPYHYAALITVKHSKVYKLCDTCGFIFMCKATFDSHLELSLCKRNLAYLKRYNEPEKFHELDFEVTENEYQWSYPKRKNPKRRTPTKPKKPVSPPKQNRRSSQKKEENLKTRSGRRVKVPQLDGNADSSDESSSRSGMEVDLPQTDGANDAQRIPAQQLPPMYQQMAPNQQQHTHNGQSLEQTLASPVFRMQPVMQQTNYIHVAKGGTVILPGGANQQNQVTHQHENQSLSGHQNNSPRVGAPQNGTPAPPGYYQVVNPQGEVIGQKPMMQNNHVLQQHPQQTQHRQLNQQPGQQIASHFPIFLTPGSSQGQPMSIQRVVAPPQHQQMRSATPQGYPQAATPTHRLTATPFDNRDILRTPLGSLGAPTPTPSFAMDQRMLEQQRLQEHRQRQQQQHQQQQRAMEEQRHREMQARAEEQHRRQEEERKRQEMIRKQREEEEKRRREEEKRQREEQQRQELIRKQQEERRILEEQHRKRMEHERLMQQQQQQQQQQEQQRRLMHQQQQQHQFHAQHQLQGLAHRQMSPGLQSPPQQQFQSQNRSPGSAHNLQSPPAQHNFQSPPLQHAQLATTPQQAPQIIQQPQAQNQQFLQAQNQQFFHNGQRFIRIQRHPQPAQTPTYINSNQRFVLASSQPIQMQQPQQMTFQQRPVASSPVNQTSQIANFANQQVIQNAKPPQYQEVQRQSSNQAPPQRYFNVGRSPKIDEYRLQQIKNDLKSPINAPTNITVKTEPPSSFQQPQQMPTMSNIYIKNEPIDEGYHKKVIKEAIQTQSELNMRKTTPPKHQAQMQNAAFGNQQFRVAPGAGPLPGLSVQHQRPSVLQHQRVQQMRVQQHVFRAYNPQNGTFTIQPQMTLAPRPAQRLPVSQVPGVPPQSDASLSAKKPWDLDLQPPRRQSGIEVVGRSPKQARPQQFQRYQVGTILPNNQGLKPGLNLINGQLIEVRNGPMPITGRQLSMDPSSFSVIKEEPKPFVFKQEPKMPKQPKVPKQKALIWDPIVLEESIVQGSLEDGFDDEFSGSILLDRLEAKKSQKCEKMEQRAETPEAVDELEEYNLSFSIVSEDGVRKTGRDLEKMWNEIIDELPTCGRLPGSAPKSTRPDVFAAFGFSTNMVRYLLEQLPLADSIPGSYKAVHFPRDEKSISVRRNSKGCWRAQGWSGKRNPQDMFSFLNSTHRSGLTHDQNFRPTMETDLPLTMRFRKMVETSRNSLQVLPSAIHGRGLFARRPYEPGELVIEYSGTVIRGELCDMREKYYDDRGIGTYMFRVDDDLVVDATMEGGRARFINHSCGPNCLSKIITVDSRKHICIIAGRFIDFGEELTYDYKFDRDFGSERIECGCQAPNCRRFMN